MADETQFRWKDNPYDILKASIIPTKESITECNTLILRQSTIQYLPKQHSTVTGRIQHIRFLDNVEPSEYELVFADKVSDQLI